MKVPMLDLAAEWAEIGAEIAAAIERVLVSGHFVLGPEGAALEKEIAALAGVPHAVACNSGTDALHLALRAAGVGPGDEVVTPAFTFIATAEAIAYVGATPVFADIDPGTYNLSAETLERALTPGTRAVIVVHLFGQCAGMPAIAELCKRRGLIVVEDCAQAIAADWDGTQAGAWGDFGCFSFYPTKNLGAYGDAGLVTTREARHDTRLRMLRHHGSRHTYLHEEIGYNSRLDELQAAVLRAKLPHLARFSAARQKHAARYRELLAGAKLQLPVAHGRGAHVYHQFTVRLANRDAARKALAAAGVASGVYYPIPLHRQPVFEKEFGGLALPAAEAAAHEVLSLPIYPQLTDEQIQHVCRSLRACL
ncbi:MAG: DegT/DnrJ/EryC1/StrS family aminotransferase [Betaproteobacteria bacterium]|nr:DegT/DnrJ/EryC1/StrS family aminotransferase [Betaproteobacteria bacterium]